MMSGGWIKLYRKFLDWEWFADAKMVQLFVYLLLSASIEQRKWKGITLERGQLATTYPELAERTNQSVRNLRTALQRLEDGQIIGRQTTNKYTIITICNFDSYQDKEESQRQTNDRPATGQRQTNDRQTTGTIAEEREEGREREEDRVTTTTTVDISLKAGAGAQARARKFDFNSLPKEQQEKEAFDFLAVMYFANAINPQFEVKKFIRHNQGFGWKSKSSDDVYDTPAQRLAIAEQWAKEDKCKKGRDQHIGVLRHIYDSLLEVRPDLAPLCVDVMNGVQFLDGPGIVVLHYPAKKLYQYLKEDAQGQAIARAAINPKFQVEISNERIYRPL